MGAADPPRRTGGWQRGLTVCVALLLAASATGWSAGPLGGPASSAQPAPPRATGDVDVIVVLNRNADPRAEAQKAGVNPKRVYQNIFRGFAAKVPAATMENLARNPNVVIISEDSPVSAFAVTVPSGVDRIDAEQNPTAAIDGAGGAVDADVAVLDTGIAAHPDLNVAGGIDCVNSGGYGDVHGHGTHVAGTIGALDNGSGVVGVAPGARLWAVKVLDDTGGGTQSTIICGLDWVVANAGTIDVVNMSLGGSGSDGACGANAYHQAICSTANAGVPMIAAAGNTAVDTSGVVPATYAEVIAVSSFSDFNGKPGGGAAASCSSGGTDDGFAGYSNFGADVDIAAPGTCILSTVPGGGTGLRTGTSMATPHVAGAAALYRAANPGASPAAVRSWLLGTAQPQGSGFGFTGDGDGSAEPVLSLGSGAAATTPTTTATPSPTATRTPTGTTSTTTTDPYCADAEEAAFVTLINDYRATKGLGQVRLVQTLGAAADYHSREMADNDYFSHAMLNGVTWQQNIANHGYTNTTVGENITAGTARATARAAFDAWLASATHKENIEKPGWTEIGIGRHYNATSTYDWYWTNTFGGGSGSTAATVCGATPSPTPTATSTRVPTATATRTSTATATPTATATRTATPRPTATRTATATPVAVATSTSTSAATSTPVATATATATATSTSTTALAPTATRTPTPKPTATRTATAAPAPSGGTKLRIAASGRSANANSGTYAYDANPSTAWYTTTSSPPTSAYVYFDLGAAKSVGTIRWLFAQTGSADAMQVQVSTDRATWAKVADVGNAAVNTWQSVAANKSARYVRFYLTNPNRDLRLGYLAEIEVYAATTTVAEAPVTAAEADTGGSAPTGTPLPPTATPTPVTTPAPTPEPVRAAESPTGTGVVSGTGDAGARCREDASVEAAIITVLLEGARVDLLGAPIGDWQPVRCQGRDGFVHRQYVVADGGAVTAGSGDPVEPTLPPSAAAEIGLTPAPTTPVAPEPAATPTPYPIAGGARSPNSTTSAAIYDRDLATYWASTGAPPAEASVLVDLGATKPIGTVRWLFAAGGLADGMRIQISEDGTTWATLAQPGNAEVGFWQELPVGVAGRYVRFFFANPNVDPAVGGLAEIEVWPATGPVAALTVDPAAPVPTATPPPTVAPAAVAPAPAVGPYPIAGSARSANSTTSVAVYDRDPATYWASSTEAPPTEAEVSVDLGAPQPIGRIRWLFAAEGLAEGMQVQVSGDGTNWAPLAQPGNGPAGFWQELPAGVTARYVRFVFANPSLLPAVGGLAEVEILP